MLPVSKYLPYFKANKDKLNESSELVGDIILVERLVFPEKKTSSGLIIVDSKKIQTGGLTSEMPEFFRVLYVGKGYYNEETGADEPIDIEQGDIILSAAVSVRVWSSIPLLETTDSNVLGITRHGDIQWRWKGEEAFTSFLFSLNEAVK